MAKRSTPSAAKKTSAVKATASEEIVTTPVRNTAIPPKSAAIAVSAPSKKSPSYDDIAIRAYLIWENDGGYEVDNWCRAERELSI